MEPMTAIWICIGMIVYYMVFQIYSDFVRSGMVHNTPNRLIEELRSEYSVNIRTFQKNIRLNGFAWFKTIWINENLFKNKKQLLFTFHHEYYHLKHHHKALVLLMRFGLSLVPLLFIILHWTLVIIILLSSALLINRVHKGIFEDKANSYAKEMTGEKKDEPVFLASDL